MNKLLQKLSLWLVHKTHPGCNVSIVPINQEDSSITYSLSKGTAAVTVTTRGGGGGGRDIPNHPKPRPPAKPPKKPCRCVTLKL